MTISCKNSPPTPPLNFKNLRPPAALDCRRARPRQRHRRTHRLQRRLRPADGHRTLRRHGRRPSADGKTFSNPRRGRRGAELRRLIFPRPSQPGAPKWGNYPRGVIAGFLERGINPGGSTCCCIPPCRSAADLSSSAALEVCTATLIEAATGKKIDPVEKALLCQKAEHEFAGVPVRHHGPVHFRDGPAEPACSCSTAARARPNWCR